MNKRILIVGSNGTLGQRFTEYQIKQNVNEYLCVSAEQESVVPNCNYAKLDITEKKDVKKIFAEFKPDVVLNFAAFTNVDGCENEKDLSYKINVTGVEYLARYSNLQKAHFVHISSDYIFDGVEGPYDENSIPNPISYYGKTKLAAENVIKSLPMLQSTILRTNVLYGPAKNSRPDFVKWVINSIRANKRIRIVTDQMNNPTFIDDMVFAIVKIIENKKFGIYNISGNEIISRYDFTMLIADYFDLDKSLIDKIVTAELNQKAVRPLSSGLIYLKAQSEFGYKPTPYIQAFETFKLELNL